MAHVPSVFCRCGGEMKNVNQGVQLFVTIRATDEPYYLLHADLLRCVDCGNQVFLNATHPCTHHHDERFDDEAQASFATARV